MPNNKRKTQKQRLDEDQPIFTPVRNKDLLCKDCMFRKDDEESLGNVSKCVMYRMKPNSVLLGGEECDFYTKE